ncbi:sensor domain-containing diguanylate cyclase [Thermocoleostomius sinensis]|uniref:Sensor domain-containing diguanylate cyclase n=1 Tax=Thermocoleostomius sinensis A174 TaxID=2016057 RepID=A0A9E8ZG71_9CYAN|nr:sensor domain-containing diguanylate cyclase [Thermocoleostomius sinensis]WAL60630.1 sensor domain-containing diguanylate cyclase [Thermocoleostomius sinensis A174]
MKSRWKQIYPWIKSAVLNLDSIDHFLRQMVEKIAAVYEADCLLWTGVEWGVTDALRVYGTPKAICQCASELDFVCTPIDRLSDATDDIEDRARNLDLSQTVHQFHPQSLPSWLLEQQRTPQLRQLDTGDLVIPVTSRVPSPKTAEDMALMANPLQFVLQLNRSAPQGTPDAIHSHIFSAASTAAPNCLIQGWTVEELESIDVLCSQIGLAYSALYWRQRLEQSRQQAALLGRISRLLNSTLNPDEIVDRIVAELGYELQCDRSILVYLRHQPVSILATWDHPERDLMPLEPEQLDREDWQAAIELFLQDGASYLQLSVNEPDFNPLQRWLQASRVQSVLLVPLFIQAEFFGAVALLSYYDHRYYLLDELQMVRQVADQAAIALTNAQHYQRLWLKKEDLQQQNSTLQQEAARDELTQLLNRRALERELNQLSTRTLWTVQATFSIIVCDIDYFKQVNDAHGHLIGDVVLQSLAQRLQSQLRRGTLAYRYGGEEFVIVLADTSLNQATDVGERLRQAICSAPVPTQVGPIEVTASFGVAQQDVLRDHSAWEVFNRADRALYEAKRLGRDRVYALS